MEISESYPNLVANVRGRGTYLAFDVPKGPQSRDMLVPLLRAQGINAGVCGTETMRLRPSLYYGEHHADILIEALKKSVVKL